MRSDPSKFVVCFKMSRVHCLLVLLVVTSQCKMLKDMDPTLFQEPAQCFLELEGKSAALTFLTLSGESRQVVKAFESIEQGEGHGARVRRSLGRPELRSLDPFLMLDEFKLENKAGEKVGFPGTYPLTFSPFVHNCHWHFH